MLSREVRFMCSVRSLLLPAAWLAFAASSHAAEPDKPKDAGPVSYYRDVRRVLQQHCQGCHQPAKPLGGYAMTEYADLFKKGDQDKPGIVAGRPELSFVVSQIDHAAGQKAAMPKNKDPIPDADIA